VNHTSGAIKLDDEPIPPPPPRQKKIDWKGTLLSMEVGQSFTTSLDNESTLRTIAARYGREWERRYRVRREGGSRTLRCWRVS